eukprot:CAMPEP_0173394208 /NCGR_PEP_ID=MMETSP1356-20130122/25744_1 /TAXON_ID=77927 ORGANISM="Hemiselmis virescens, Strain PCC157" /NCGR_SAMPLE_ID=MMETSP1356 /ASSEMBLY_ACC=CAM_ASM_000847 /LENGTH=45 /DNA_ID= /DNA_START= /DNA_END= /DNA_ORIENTATION=
MPTRAAVGRSSSESFLPTSEAKATMRDTWLLEVSPASEFVPLTQM